MAFKVQGGSFMPVGTSAASVSELKRRVMAAQQAVNNIMEFGSSGRMEDQVLRNADMTKLRECLVLLREVGNKFPGK